MLDLCQAFVVPSEAQRFPPPGVDSEMRNETMASRCANGRSGFPMLILVGMALLGKAAPAQTIRVDTTAGRAIRFDPDQALGSSMDILPANLVDKVYSEPILKESLSAGWGPITYRQNTELTIAAWHWNPIGTWSDPSHQSGYFTGSAEPQGFLRFSFGSLVLINKDPSNAHAVKIEFADAHGKQPAHFSGPLTMVTFGAEQYHWHPEGAKSHADPDGPAARTTLSAKSGEVVTLAKASVTVLRGKID